MIIIHVEHFLNKAGKKYFPIFIKEMRKAMIKYNKGFISLRQLEKEDATTETHFLLEYENIDLLQEFSKTEPHVKLIEEIKKHQVRKQTVEKFHPIEN